MKRMFIMIFVFGLTTASFGQKLKQTFISSDLENFWIAYDRIIATKDTSQQLALLKELYLDKATEGLKGLIEVRNYSEKEYIDCIIQYPKFWSSLRPNTLIIKSIYPEIDANIQKLQRAYPDLSPATIYFSVGAFRTGGTIQGNKVLIGSELSLADKTIIIDELPDWRQNFYKTQNPLAELPLLCTHEYVHVQQKEIVENLLSMCLYEGVAEFVSCKVTGLKSNVLAIEFGKANQKLVVDKFVTDLFLMSNNYNWLWGENRNELKVRDLGYYVGYEICERFYNLSEDKEKAIKDLIELDYTNEKEVERIVDLTRLLPGTLEELYNSYEKQRPTVIKLTPFENGSQNVKSGPANITVTFSEPLNGYNDGLDFGPLGEEYCPKINPKKFWSDGGRSWTLEAELKPNHRYQILISGDFRKENGVRLKPYLIDFRTAD